MPLDPPDPDVMPMFGCQVYTRASIPARGRIGRIPEYSAADVPCWTGYRSIVSASEDAPETGDPCEVCGAIFDASGRVRTIELSDSPVKAIRTGIHAGDDGLVCGRCLCLSPKNRAKVRAGTRPRPRRPLAYGGPDHPVLTREERAGLVSDATGRTRPIVRAFFEAIDAEERGDLEIAESIRSLIADAEKITAREFKRRLQAIDAGGLTLGQ